MLRRILIAAIVTLIAGACGDSPTDPSKSQDQHHVEAAVTRLDWSALGESARISATRAGDSVAVALSLVDERRWNDSLPVVSASGNLIVATGAGTATVAVAARDSRGVPDTINVTVSPDEPYIASFQYDDAVGGEVPLVVHGYRLEDLSPGAITAGLAVADLTRTDSANYELRFPPIDDACAPNRFTLLVDGADNLVEAKSFPRVRIAGNALNIGETARFSGTEMCIPIDGPDEALYALAFYDTRYAYWESAEQLPYYKTEKVAFSLSDLSGPETSVSRSVSLLRPYLGAAPRTETFPTAPVPGMEWAARDEPFAPQDIFNMTDMTGETYDVVVLAVVNDYLTLVSPADTAQAFTPAALDSVVAQMEYMDRTLVPHLETLVGRRPATAAGQYMIVARPNSDSNVSAGSASRWYQLVTMGTNTAHTMRSAHYVMAHELVHSFHAELTWIQSETFGTTPSGEQWSKEGVADFIAYPHVAERYGYSFTENATMSELHGRGDAVLASSNMEGGYGAVAAFGMDLTWRLSIHSEIPWEAAHDSIALAMFNGRYGCSWMSGCETFDGLFDLMRRHYGARWDPADAVLTLMLSDAADDRIDHPVFRNPGIKDAYAQFPQARERPTITGGSGEHARLDGLTSGSAGYFQLSGGGTFAIETDAPTAEWQLLRIR